MIGFCEVISLGFVCEGEWNYFCIDVIDDMVSVWINEELVWIVFGIVKWVGYIGL